MTIDPTRIMGDDAHEARVDPQAISLGSSLSRLAGSGSFSGKRRFMLSAPESSPPALTPSGRISYARIDEKLPIPNLIELQLDSFHWFVEKGLRELFDEISPIKDFTGKVMELQFLDYEFA